MPEKPGPAEQLIYTQLDQIKQFILDQLGDQPFSDDPAEPVRETTVKCTDGVHLTLSEFQRHAGNETAEDWLVMIGGGKQAAFLWWSSDGTCLLRDTSVGIDVDSVPINTVVATEKGRQAINQIAQTIAERSAYIDQLERHPLPTHVTFEPLTPDEKEQSAEQAQRAIGQTGGNYLPQYRLVADSGEVWLCSDIQDTSQRLFAVLYQPDQTGNLQPFVVYSSKSHGAWRLLPKIDSDQDHNRYNKGHYGETNLNLPISLQQALWTTAVNYPVPQLEEETAKLDFFTLTARTYSPGLSGAVVEPLVPMLESENLPDWLPQTADHATASFDFYNPLYGRVTARIVTSHNGQIRYLMGHSPNYSLPWVICAEPVTAQMLSSFTLDTMLPPSKHFYATPLEHHSDPPHAYTDNTANQAQSPAVQSYLGQL